METGSFQYEGLLSFRHFHDYGRKDMHPRNAVWILLMVQKSGEHQFRLVGYPIIQQRFLHRRWCRYSSINSQYCHMKVWKQGYHFQRRDFVIFVLNFRDANEFLACPNLLDIMSLKIELFEVFHVFSRGRGRAKNYFCLQCLLLSIFLRARRTVTKNNASLFNIIYLQDKT